MALRSKILEQGILLVLVLLLFLVSGGSTAASTAEECNLFVGSWVVDETYPLYTAASCPFVQHEFNCVKNGRPDLGYTKYRWQPLHCDLSRFDGKLFLEKLGGKSILFVGDSLSRNQWQSLTCMLHSAVPNARYTLTRVGDVSTFTFTGTAATKVKMAQKEAQGVAEKRKGRRGPSSVIGSSAAGCVCAFLMINKVGGQTFAQLWRLGFVASFCTKLSDTVSSEIGKAYGRITYLVTTFKVVPRGTEGAVSLEGTFAGLLAAIALAFVGYLLGDVTAPEAIVCAIASQIANLGESIIGAVFQGKEGFRWLNNDVVNVINISIGSILAMLMQQLLLGH